MNNRTGKNKISFAEENFEIHGEFEGVVYRNKRNGEQEKYPYEPVSYYERTALTIRNEWIRKYAARVSNPRRTDYAGVIRKLNYYTPYILPAGTQEFQGETVFYVRERGDYEFRWQDSPMGFNQIVAPRTMVELSFHAEGEFGLDCWYQGELYCQRNFIITPDDLDLAYDAWLAANMEYILTLPEPEYESLKTYRRGMRSKANWLMTMTGRYNKEVVYEVPEYKYKDQKRQRPWLYHRRKYDHSVNPQTQFFNAKMVEIGKSWQELSPEEQKEWNKEATKLTKQRITGFNLYTRAQFEVY